MAVFFIDDLFGKIEVFFEVFDKDRARNDSIGNWLGDFGFAASRDGAGLMANTALCGVADEAPATTFGRLHHLDFIAGGEHVGVVW